jgi:hypothetical protein
MLMPMRFREPIERGEVTLTFRRWKRSQVLAGRTYRTGVGRLVVEAVDVVNPNKISAADARAAGFGSRRELLDELRGETEWPTYRIQFHLAADADPRDELAADAALDAEQVEEIDRRLDRLDRASRNGPWTRAVLQVIADRPGVRATDLAASFGRETQAFKLDVRKLKNLGLTISLMVGYELSPRGQEYVRASGLGAGTAGQ